MAQKLGSDGSVSEVVNDKNRKPTKEEVNFKEDGGTPNYLDCSSCQHYENGQCTLLGVKVGPEDYCDAFVENLQSGRKSASMSMAEMQVRTIDVPFFIYKVSTDKQSGVKRWYSTASGIEKDLYEERMSIPLFKSFIKRIETRDEVPEPFSSEAWKGGLPYLGVAHYLDQGGAGIVGDCEQVFVDGQVLKMRGTFKPDSKLADAAYNAIQRDIQEDRPHNERVRVSIAFVDWAHKHEGVGEFFRKSLIDRCPFCESGVGNKIYLDGQLVHLALTRRPAYPDTSIGLLEERSMAEKKSSRYDDASSIVGEELAEELEQRATITLRSKTGEEIAPDAIVVKQEVEDENDEEEDEDEKKKRKKKGGSAADAEMTEEVESEDEEAGAAFRDAPLGGAKSIDEANAFLAKSGTDLIDSWGVFADVLSNIVPEENRTGVRAAVKDFQSLLDQMTIKAVLDVQKALHGGAAMAEKVKAPDAVDVEEEAPEVEAEDVEPVIPHPLEDALLKIRQDFDDAVATEGDRDMRLAMLQPSINGLAEVIMRHVDTDVSGEAPVQPAGVSRADVESMLAPIMATLAEIQNSMSAPESRPAPAPPVRRAIQSVYSQVPQPAGKPSSLKSVIRRSVGIRE